MFLLSQGFQRVHRYQSAHFQACVCSGHVVSQTLCHVTLINFILLGLCQYLTPCFAGQPFSHFTKRAKWLVVTTTSQAACSLPGSATIRAGSPPTRYASTSGTPCRTCSRTAPIRPCCSLTCRYPSSALLCSSCLAGGNDGRFVFVALLQADRKGADGATDQNSSEGDHDAERPGECHLQRGISVYNEGPWGV